MMSIARIATGASTGLTKQTPGARLTGTASQGHRATKVTFPGPFLQSQATPAVAAVDTRGIFGTVLDMASLLDPNHGFFWGGKGSKTMGWSWDPLKNSSCIA